MASSAAVSASLNKKGSVSIAIPNDTTNEARALLLLESLEYITLKDNAGITATIKEIKDNPYNIQFNEVEAAQIPNILQDVDYAVINSNYAISAGINPVKESLAIEGSSSAYSNIIAVKQGNESKNSTKALVAALQSKQVADFIAENYKGAVVSVVEKPGDGYDSTADYAALKGSTISVAASSTPHAEILQVVKEILAKKGIKLIYGIIGMSGAGKSTLVRCVNMLERPSSGTVYIDGVNIGVLSNSQLRKARRKISMVFQSFNLLVQRDCLANIYFPLKLAGVKKQEQRHVPWNCFKWWACLKRRTHIRLNSQAGSSNASRLRGPLRRTRRFFCATRPQVRSTQTQRIPFLNS